jgi:hypothetical protein
MSAGRTAKAGDRLIFIFCQRAPLLSDDGMQDEPGHSIPQGESNTKVPIHDRGQTPSRI